MSFPVEESLFVSSPSYASIRPSSLANSISIPAQLRPSSLAISTPVPTQLISDAIERKSTPLPLIPLSSSKIRRHKRKLSIPPQHLLVSSRAASRAPSPAPATYHTTRSTQVSRDKLFEALEIGGPLYRLPRIINGADDLDEPQLKRCFEILHACGIATDPTATRGTTRETMEGFLDAVFHEWTGDSQNEPEKPLLDFTVQEYVRVGSLCNKPADHLSPTCCYVDATCQTAYALAKYRSQPGTLDFSFCLSEPRSDENPTIFNPL